LPIVLLFSAVLIAAFGPVWETSKRAPEGTARAYLAAVEAHDLDAALATIAPEARDAARERIQLQLGNRYRIETLVLGQPSVLDRVLGRPLAPAWASVLAEVTDKSGDRWKSPSPADLVERDCAWYLLRPLFA